MDDLTTKLAEALRRERTVRAIGQDPHVHWESIRELRRECYAQTDEALRLYEQAKAQPVQDLPPLPEPTLEDQDYELWGQNVRADMFTADQMRYYARAAMAATPAPEPLHSKLLRDGRRDAAEATLQRLGYEWRGGELWAPPIGKAPAWGVTPLNVLRDMQDNPARYTAAASFNPSAVQTVQLETATPAPAPLPEGWKFNHARQQTDDDGPVSGVWEIGWLEDEDNYFAPIVTVDTALYYQDKDAEPLAKSILALLAGQGKDAK